ncbi:hypothetical protein [Snuella sedimenti]|uniref:Lipocalin-like domain-containing protein n=1 Tax=Snuella sedimenti TaxID=2798802 RepID=A0A8J7LNG5_9FLAO|nr:hypothetical protein [Snuella sedimenti]MBJ6368769.1 hypothetical protein [Snuella sedimenti]
MKKLVSICYLACLLVFFSSCSSDDVDVALEGTWNLSAWQVNTPMDLNSDGVKSTNLLTEFGYLNNSTLVITDNFNGSIFYSALHVSFNAVAEGEMLTFMSTSVTDSDNAPLPFTYTKSDNTIVVDADITLNKVGGSSVLTFKDNTLTMEVANGFVVKDSETSETILSQDVTYVFTKG